MLELRDQTLISFKKKKKKNKTWTTVNCLFFSQVLPDSLSVRAHRRYRHRLSIVYLLA